MTSILAIDLGTSSVRAVLFSKAGTVLAIEQQEYPCIYPQEGYVEQDPVAIWTSTVAVCGLAPVLLPAMFYSREWSGTDEAAIVRRMRKRHYRGRRHHESAGDDGDLGPRDGRAVFPRYRVE